MSGALVLVAYVGIASAVAACLVYLYRTRPGAPARKPRPESDPASAAPAQVRVDFQGADFNSTSHGDLDSSGTLWLFRDMPWSAQLRDFQHRESSGLEGCPPNLTLVAAGKRLLQLACTDEDEFWLHLDSPRSSYQIEGLRTREIEEVIRKFFSLEPRAFDAELERLGSARATT